MKKKLLLIILLLIPFTVFAKEEFYYGWSKENEKGIVFIKEEDNAYEVYDETSSYARLTYYQPNGKKIRSERLDDSYESWLIWEEANMRLPYNDWYNFQKDGKSYSVNPYLGDIYVYDPKTDNEQNYYYGDLTITEQKAMTGDYHLLFELFKKAQQINSEDYFYMVSKKHSNIVLRYVQKRSIDDYEMYLDIYDKKEKLVLSKKMRPRETIVNADMNLYGIYLIEASYDHEKAASVYTLIKYDLNGQKEYQKNITSLLEEAVDNEFLYYSSPLTVDVVNNGLIIGLGNNQTNYGIQECIRYFTEPVDTREVNPNYPENIYEYCMVYGAGLDSVEDVAIIADGNGMNSLLTTMLDAPFSANNRAGQTKMSNSNSPDTLIKLSIEYEIKTQVNGNGTVSVVSRSESGDEVTFEVTPKKGYVLSVVKVTDANGNVIEFTENRFTMPSSDVMIEAVFIPENPNTKDIAVVIVLLLAIMGGLLLIVGGKKAKWLRQ